MKPRKKSAFFTFFLSFCPGLAEMYMGFMKMGVSLLSVFAAFVMIPSLLDVGDIFMMPAFVVWFYGFFHARNISAANDEDFAEILDGYIWDELIRDDSLCLSEFRSRRIIAVLLIISGCSTLWSHMVDLLGMLLPRYQWDRVEPFFDTIPSIIGSVVIIVLGVLLVRGKKEKLEHENAGE